MKSNNTKRRIMDTAKINNIQSILLKTITGLAAVVISLTAFNVVSEELNNKTADEKRYESMKDNLVKDYYNDQEICTRANKANNTNVDCDVVSDESKKIEIDLCKTASSAKFCETIVNEAANQFDDEVKKSKENGTYKVSSTERFKFIDDIKLPPAPAWVKERQVIPTIGDKL